MPASVVVVHDDPAFLRRASTALRHAGHEVAAFNDPMRALDALEAAARVEILVTPVNFPEGKPNGISLALVTRTKRPNLKVVVANRTEYKTLTEGIGELLPPPIELPTLVATVTRLAGDQSTSG